MMNLLRRWKYKSLSQKLGVKRIYHFQGGLGNQMFQYAFALAHQREFPTESVIDTEFYTRHHDHNGWEMDDVFELPDKLPTLNPRFSKDFRRLHKKLKNYVGEQDDIRYKPDDWHGGDGWWTGYRASYKYFRGAEMQVRHNFVFKSKKNLLSSSVYQKIKDSESVALHVRRGDYLAEKNNEYLTGICTKSYYDTAIRIIREKVENPHFFIFSDDIEWCREVFRGEEYTFVDGNTAGDSWKDMCLMSECKHNIIANSSFSWWGMWLGQQQGKVVVGPSKFLNGGLVLSDINDILPTSVIQVDELGKLVAKAESSELEAT